MRAFLHSEQLTRILIVVSLLLALLALAGVALRPRATRADVAAAPTPSAAPTARPRPAAMPTAAPPTPSPEPSPLPLLPSPTPLPETVLGPLGSTLDAYLKELVDAELFHGSVLVARGDTVLLRKGYGPADVAAGTPNTANTRFRLASLSKQFTAMAIMQLYADGKLALTDPACAYLDECPAAWQPITLHQLLTHTSGLPNYTDFFDYGDRQVLPSTPQEIAAHFRDEPLLFAPGSAYSYGNSAYLLLGMVVERVSGQPYAAYLHERIFGPLAMASTDVVDGTAFDPGDARGYQQFEEVAPALNPGTLFGAGSLASTVDDLYRWDQALYTEQLLPRPLLEEMFTPNQRNYGYGWRITSVGGRRYVSHMGDMDGFSNAILRIPAERVTVIVLGNMYHADAQGIGEYIASIVLGSP